MAGNDMDLRVRLLGDSSDLEAATRDAEQSTDRLARTMAGLGVAGAAGGAALAVGFARTADLEEGTARLQAQLDLTADEAGEMGALAGEVYASNFGADMTAVNEAIRSVTTNLGDIQTVGEEALQGATEAALTLADVMGVEVAESAQAAAALVKNGLAKDSEEAFDIIAAGFQDGANKADDFLETITEYSPQFAKLGLDGSEALALLSTGLKAGARDTDVIADAFKEFSLRAIDGSKLTASGYSALGIDAREAAAAIAAGGDGAQAMTQQVLRGLAALEDPVAQNTAGTALFGTQWEDTLRQIVEPMAAANLEVDNLAGSVDQMTAAMGGTGKARVETLRRELDAWVQSQIQGTGVSSTAVAAIGSFGPAALSMAGSIGMAVAGLAALNVGAGVARVTQLASAAATGVWTAAQWLLNAALTANPIGLIIVGIAALIAALIVAYKRSETFRAIVDGALRGVGAALGWLWGKAKAVFGWLTTGFARVLATVRELPGKIKGAFSDAGTWLADAGRRIIDGLIGSVRRGFDRVRETFSGLTDMIPDWKGPAARDDALLRAPADLIMGGFSDQLGSHFGAIESQLGGFTVGLGRKATLGMPAQRAGVAGGGGVTNVYIQGPLITDDRALMQRIESAKRGTGRARTLARVGA